MNNHLKAAVERHKGKSCLINPICQSDAEIISELIIAVGRIDNERAYDLKKIVEQWKYLKDENIAELMLGFNIDNPEILSDASKEAELKKRKFISFQEEILEVSLIKTIGIDDYYNYSTNEMEYHIVINKNLEEKYMLTNGRFKFKTHELRGKKLDELKMKLGEFIKII